MLHNLFRRLSGLRRLPAGTFYSGDLLQPSDVNIRYLGTAGFVIEGGGQTIVIDPYVSRPGFIQSTFKGVRPDADLVRQYVPRADDVLIGHSHIDHILDAPELCRQTGARFIGSESAAIAARAYGLPPEQIVVASHGDEISSGDAVVRAIESKHGKVLLGTIPYPGEIAADFSWPARSKDLRVGKVLNWHLSIGGVSIVHIDSADYLEDHFRGLTADILCLCAVGRKHRPNYTRNVIDILQPKYVIPCHWDNFFRSASTPLRPILFVDLPGFVKEIANCGPQPIVLPFNGQIGVPRPTQ